MDIQRQLAVTLQKVLIMQEILAQQQKLRAREQIIIEFCIADEVQSDVMTLTNKYKRDVIALIEPLSDLATGGIDIEDFKSDIDTAEDEITCKIMENFNVDRRLL